MSLRISVTELDSWRYFKATEDFGLEDFLAQLRRETPPTVNMLAGSAWHKALERMEWGQDEAEVVQQDGFIFRIVGDVAIDLPVVAELKGELEMPTPSGTVTLVGIVDGLDAKGIRDYKLTGQFDAEKYADSYQWRCYLMMFGGKRFTYCAFVGREEARTGDWLISDYHELPFYAYPDMGDDVYREVCDFAAFLARYMPERVRPELALQGAH